MSIFARLAVLFVLVPILELALLLRIGGWIGLWPTLGLVLATGVVGAALARAQGLRVARDFQSELASGRMPGRAAADGAAVLVGGTLLLTPGVLTDLLGFSLLLPPTRRALLAWAMRGFERRLEDGSIRATVVRVGPFPPAYGSREPRDQEWDDVSVRSVEPVPPGSDQGREEREPA